MNCLKNAELNEEVYVVDIEHTALMKRRLMDRSTAQYFLMGAALGSQQAKRQGGAERYVHDGAGTR